MMSYFSCIDENVHHSDKRKSQVNQDQLFFYNFVFYNSKFICSLFIRFTFYTVNFLYGSFFIRFVFYMVHFL